MATTKMSPVSPVRPDDKRRAPSSSFVLKLQDSSAAEAYEQYLRLPELSTLWNTTTCPGWADEALVKPALQALEITFRLVSVALSDPRAYACRRELARRLESLAAREVELVAALCEDQRSAPPLAELSASGGVLSRERSASEVWQLPGSASAVVCHASEESLLPRLAAWEKAGTVAARIRYAIEAQMQGCAFSLGLGEPNLAGKPVLLAALHCFLSPARAGAAAYGRGERRRQMCQRPRPCARSRSTTAGDSGSLDGLSGEVPERRRQPARSGRRTSPRPACPSTRARRGRQRMLSGRGGGVFPQKFSRSCRVESLPNSFRHRHSDRLLPSPPGAPRRRRLPRPPYRLYFLDGRIAAAPPS